MSDPMGRQPDSEKPGERSGGSPPDGLSLPASMAWASVSEALSALSSKARGVLVAQRVGVLAACSLGVATGLALLDYALRVPWWLRGLTLPAWLGLLGWFWWVWVLPALRFRPGVTEVALRVERAYPELKGQLGAASDLARGLGSLPSDTSRKMADVVVRSVAGKWGSRGSAALVRTHGLKRAGLGLLAAASVCAGLFALSPSNWWIGAQRVLMPWGGSEWPKRTGIADATEQSVHALGESLPLRAVLTRSEHGPDKTDVFVEYRFLKDGRAGSWRKELLTWQGRDEQAEHAVRDPLGGEQKARVGGPLFERLVDPTGESIEYRVLTADDESDTRTIRLVPPPALMSATAEITPPLYAADGGVGVKADLGAGSDERANAPASLAGSRVTLALILNKPATFEPDLAAQMEQQGSAGAALSGSGNRWVLKWTLAEPLRLIVRPVDEFGIAATEDAVLRFEALQDKPAEATITAPSSDRGVLATALVPVVGEGRDDVGLRWVSLERQIAKPAGLPEGEKSGPGGALEPVGAPEEVAREGGVMSGENVPSTMRTLSVGASVDLAVLGLRAGDEVRLTALAKDVFTRSDAEGMSERAPTRSAVRTLRIISESQFIDEVQRELSQVRQSAIRIEAQQGEVQSRTDERGADRQSRRGQAQVSERLSRQGEAVERVADRVKENGLMDPALGEVLNQAAQSLERAGQASSRAGRTLDEASAGRAEPQEDEPKAAPVGGEKAGAAVQDQQRVRDEMTNLAELLDRGQDNWVVKNRLDQLIKAQESLREQTRSLGNQTAGKSGTELSKSQRRDLDSVVEKQTQLAEEVAKLAREMREKSKELSKRDAAAGKGMQEAAERAEQQQVSEGMKSAASNASQNRMSDAGQRQEQAAKALRQMKEDLDAGEKRQAQMLKRKLQEIAEAIERLLKEQERQIGSLEAAQRAQGGYEGLDKGMIALNQNTLGVTDQARAVKGLEPVTKLLGKAGNSQSDAVKALRSPPVDPEPVRMLEQESLDALRTALDRAKELGKKAQESEDRQKLEELKQRYGDALREQSRLRAETNGFAGVKELSRRDKVLLRRLGEGQRELGDRLRAVHEETKEIQEATVFDYAHKRLAETTGSSADALERADAPLALRPQDASIATIKSLIEALTDPKRESKFSEGAQAGGGGAGGAGGKDGMIPPARQLRLLRLIQSDIARATNEANQNEDGRAAAAEEIAKQQRDIATVGLELIKKMSSGSGGGKAEIPFGPAPVVPGEKPDPAEEKQGADAPDGKPSEVPSAS